MAHRKITPNESYRYLQPAPPKRHFVSPRARETGHRVADFNTLDDLVAHARGEGATHILSLLKRGTGEGEQRLYFPRGGGYEEALVWQKDGYWHTQGPSARKRVAQPPGNAVPIEQYGSPRRAFGYTDQVRESPRRSAHHHPGRQK